MGLNDLDNKDEGDQWERDTLEKVLFASLKEQRRTRRWGIFFKLLFSIYVFFIIWSFNPIDIEMKPGKSDRHVALVELTGVIADGAPANAHRIIAGLQDAFEDKKTAAVILEINSPGGSPVQSGYMNDEIRRLRKQYTDIPLYVVIEDICASGGYFVAVAADQIYANKASIVGSIGVRMDGFGFVEAMNKLGVERRLLTAGEHKGFLDPFLPRREEDEAHIKGLLNNIHQQFITVVKNGRGNRLEDDPMIFSGMVWTAEQALEKGMIDGFGSSEYVAREIVGVDNLVDFTPQPDLLEQFSARFGASVAAGLSEYIGLSGIH
ncbi:MAG: S49 family peptidase [Gammaproteobacteria bacterium]|nr:S49 family peptidase [Gammaproteobacteria bacterium]